MLSPLTTLALLTLTLCSELLDSIPVNFQLQGNVSYVPTSGGVSILGYVLKIGFNKHSWVGIKFMSMTSRSLYDVLVVRRESTATGGFYRIVVSEHYVAASRQDKLNDDVNNNMDRRTETYTDSNYYEATVYRTKGDTQGEDWEGGKFVKICFVTSDGAFSADSWSGLKQSCYGYDVDANYISTYRGREIGSMNFDGVPSAVYGGIEGPVLSLVLFWYCPKTSLSSSNIFIRLGDKISQTLGYDYHKCGAGDHFGLNTGALTPDSTWSGYNDGICTVSSSAEGTKVYFARDVLTGDDVDATIYNQTDVCVTVGNNQACQNLKLQILFPVMSVDSALIVHEEYVKAVSVLLLFGVLVLLQ